MSQVDPIEKRIGSAEPGKIITDLLAALETTAQPQSLVNVANHFRNATEMIGKDDHIAKTGKMVRKDDQTTAFVFKGYHEYPCSRKGTIERDGHWYCGQHDPVAVKAKNDARTAAWKAERAQEQKARQVAAAERAVIDAAKAYANDTLTGRAVLSQELIKAVRALEALEG